MIALLVLAAGQLYNSQLSVSFARATAIAPPLPIAGKTKFKVSIFNGTKGSVTIPDEKCSWGYGALSFEVKDPAEHVYRITRKPKSWKANFPMPVEVISLGYSIRTIDFSDGTWNGLPAAIAGSVDGWQIKAKFAVLEDKVLTKEKFWIGEIQTGFTRAAMKD